MNKIGISQKAIVLNSERKLLVIRRSETAPVRPLHWDLHYGENPIQGIVREVKEETGLTIQNPEPFDVEAHVNPNGDFWVTIAYKAEYDFKDVKLSYEHDKFRWVMPKEFLELKSSKKLQRFVKKLIYGNSQ